MIEGNFSEEDYRFSLEDTTLVDILSQRVVEKPEATAYIFVQYGQKTLESKLTYQCLEKKAKAIAAVLQSQLVRGDRALLIYPPGLEFITAFFGCLYAGVVAVPAYPPRKNRNLSRVQAIVSDAQAKIVLTTSSLSDELKKQQTGLGELPWLGTDRIEEREGQQWQKSEPKAKDLAFLQYTSGSTGTPKGVMVSHGNIIYNQKMIQWGFEHDESTIFAGWLPLFHDMGLIGNILQPLYLGIPCILMSPAAFLQKPIRWLKAISDYRATTSGGPNFAYDLCCNRISDEEKARLDLSSWKIAFNGAEPIRAQTLQRFTEAFAPCGFRSQAFYPCYGMAETTLLVSGGKPNQKPVIKAVESKALEKNKIRYIEPTESSNPSSTSSSNLLVGCGKTLLEQEIVIVDPETKSQCPPEQVGEIWVLGDNIAQGYWQREVETKETFAGDLSDSNRNPYLRTGDLGFLDSNGELFVTGRLKDLIIIGGRNYYPQDIEHLVEKSHPALKANSGAAFSVEIEGQERLIILQEVERTYLRNLDVKEIIGAVRATISEEFDLEVDRLLLLKTNSILKTSSGKIQRRGCRSAFLEEKLNIVGQSEFKPSIQTQSTPVSPVSPDSKAQTPTDNLSIPSARAISQWLINKIAENVGLAPTDIKINRPLAEYGLSSMKAIGLSGELQDWLGRELPVTLLYEYPTIVALSEYLGSSNPLIQQLSSQTDLEQQDQQPRRKEPIAIIGIGCRLPGGVNNGEEFWQLLNRGQDAITQVPPERWSKESYPKSTHYGGFLDQVTDFDADFFSIAPREAITLDPQHRLLLEVSWEAIEDSVQSPGDLFGSPTGVFIGMSTNDYAQLLQKAGQVETYFNTGNAFSTAAGRLSYSLGLTGPSLAMDTACSSSLVAVHTACQSLRRGECRQALAGGVNLILSPDTSLVLSQSQMLAEDGRCKTFDGSANGYVRGEGCGIVLLKRLSDAIQDGDIIQGVIRGSAINQDGRSNGLTAPNGLAQEQVIRAALKDAEVTAEEIDYVEAHGTGTALGDPIELRALQNVLRQKQNEDNPLWVGSVKTNVGHLEAAAGITGLIKVVQSLKNAVILPHLHLQAPSPYFDWKGLQVPTESTAWPQSKTGLRKAGLSSFGFSGTNVHLILEESPVNFSDTSEDIEKQPAYELEEVSRPIRPAHLLTLSATSTNALKSLGQLYYQQMKEQPELNLGDLCFSANTGRSHFSHRLALMASSEEELKKKLGSWLEGKETREIFENLATKQSDIAFLFTGQGSQYVNMGQQLYETQPIFKTALDDCAEILRSYLDKPLLEIIYAPEGEEELINQTQYTQPALFALEYSLYQLWTAWGIHPTVVMGHSVGEYVAACVAGVFSLEDGLKLIASRGQLMQKLPGSGIMVSLMASEEQVKAAITQSGGIVAIAAINGPQSTVISGEVAAVEAVVEQLNNQGIKSRQLAVSHGFHSPLMEPMLAEFEVITKQIIYHQPQIPVISNITGIIADESISTASYWVNHVCQPVQFAASIATLSEQGYQVFVEIGPQPILLAMAKQCLPEGVGICLPSLRPNQEDWPVILESLAQLYVQGFNVDWLGFEQDYSHRKVTLPTYPFQRQRYWLEITDNGYSNRSLFSVDNGKQKDNAYILEHSTTSIVDWLNKGNTEQLVQELQQKDKFSPEQISLLPELLEILVKQHQGQLTEAKIKDWFYQVQWQPFLNYQVQTTVLLGHWLIFADSTNLGRKLGEKLRQQGAEYSLVYRGENYQQLEKDTYQLDPSNPQNIEQLILTIQENSKLPLVRIVHLWSLDAPNPQDLTITALKQVQHWGCGTVLYLLQALIKTNSLAKLWLVTRGSQSVLEQTEKVSVAATPLWGLGRVISLEHPQLWGGLVDLDPQVPRPGIDIDSQKLELKIDVAPQSLESEIDINPQGVGSEIDLDLQNLDSKVDVYLQNLEPEIDVDLQNLESEIDINSQAIGSKVDIDPQSLESEVETLFQLLVDNEPPEEHFALRKNQTYIARLVQESPPDTLPVSLESNATYLITGGLGALGLETAKWMVEKGARNLVLISRSAAKPEQINSISCLEQLGAKVTLAQADVCNLQQLSTVLTKIDDPLSPLKGIVHAAGIVAFQPLEQIDLTQLETVMAAKTIGAWTLHRLTQEQKLDFFVTFSSISSVWGAAGQAHYAASNHFLDGLTHYRRSQGLPSLSINWGPWSGGGMVKENELQELSKRGVKPLVPEEGLAALEKLWSSDNPQTIVANIDWSLFKQLYQTEPRRLLLEKIEEDSIKLSQNNVQSKTKICQEIEAIDISEPRERERVLITYLQTEVAKVLRSNPAEVEVEKSLSMMGIDSLMALELRNKLQTDLLIDVPVVKFIEDINIVDLAVEVNQKVSLMGSEQTVEAEYNEGLIEDKSQEKTLENLTDSLVTQPNVNQELPEESSDIVSVASLSYGQRSLWFLWQLAPESHAYNVSLSLRIGSVVDQKAMAMALEEIVKRHSILRTTFPQKDQEPIQQIHQHQPLDFQIVDASSWNEEELKNRVIESHQMLFALEKQPVLRVRWFTHAEQDHILLITIHHIACDRWSLDILLQELPQLYQAKINNRAISLPLLKQSYADYVNWQRHKLSGSEGEKLEHYWLQQLGGDLPLLNLPTDRLRPPIQSYNGAAYHFKLSSQLITQLKELAQSKGVTFYMMLLAAFQVLLYRYTGQEDILVGSPTSGRSQLEFAPIFGYFVDPVVIRGDLGNNPSFDEFLGQIRQTVLQALTHQDYPFALLVEKLQPERDPSRSPIFQAFFALQQLQQSQDILLLLENETEEGVEWGGLNIKPFDIPQLQGLFDLSLDVVEAKSSALASLKYNADLFDESTIERMATHFQNLLSTIVENSQQKVSELSLLSQTERHQLLVQWNNTEFVASSTPCLQQLFEAQVEKTPHAIAVVFEQEQLTYQQLNEKANQLAHYLQELGVILESRVAVYNDRSLQTIVAILAIFKAGGAYVVMENTTPSDRLAALLEQLRPTAILTQTDLISHLPSDFSSPIIKLDQTLSEVEIQPNHNPIPMANGEHLAYIIFTSGSTGKPKGVAVEHRHLVNYVDSITCELDLETGLQFAIVSTLAADLGHTVMFPALCSGGTLHVINQTLAGDPQGYANYCQDHPIDVLKIVPGHLDALLQADPPQAVLPRKTLVLGGDKLSWNLVTKIQGLADIRILNHYGPSETTVGVLTHKIEGTDCSSVTVPLGRPLPHAQIYLLDQHLQPVPIGVPGELYIGGASVARGYLDQPTLTAERFIQNTLNNSDVPSNSPSSNGSERLYKTGDLGRWLPTGTVEFLGRIDNQVKIRGFRIELGEIEATLQTHPEIRETVVITREEQPGNNRLVAYIVSTAESLSKGEVDDFLKQQLPEYMIPSAVMFLEELPLTSNGKINRQALPVPDFQSLRDSDFVAPQTPSQELIAEIFADVLGVKVGIHDSFFALGGHSLLATRIIYRLRQAFNIEVPLRSLFESPTVAELDKIVSELRQTEELSGEDSHANLPVLVPDSEQWFEPFPLTDIQQAYWIGRGSTFDLGNIASHGYAELDCQNLDLNALNRAWQRVVDHHPMLRAIVLENGQQQIQSEVTPYEFIVRDLRQESDAIIKEELEGIRDEMSHQILSTNPGPLYEIRATLINEHLTRLHFSIDTLICDAWSINLMGKQWFDLYEDPSGSLPEIDLWFRDYVLGVSVLKDSPQYQRSRTYWVNRIDSLPPAPELPLARNLNASSLPQFKRRSSEVCPEHWQKLKDKAVQANLTPTGLLLAAFVDVLNLWSKNPKFTVNLTLFNRFPLHPHVNKLVGDFTSVNLLEVDNSTPASFIERAQRIQLQLWQDLDHQYFSGVEVQREIRRQRQNYQLMGVVFTSVLGINSLEGEEFNPNRLGELVYEITQTPQVWLDNQVHERDGSLIFDWDAVEDLFPAGLLDDMFASYCQYLEDLATSEAIWEQSVPQLLPVNQIDQITAVNATEATISDQTLHGLFLKQAKINPEAIALITPEKTLTYEQLYVMANQLGHQLRQGGAVPNQLVAVMMDKGWEQVVAVLGILMSGAAYLPIDVRLPLERQKYLLEQGEVKLVVTQSWLKEELSFPSGVQCFLLDLEAEQDEELAELESIQSVTDLAYVIYTSGSTGVPKGVMIDHQGAVNTILDINQRFDIGEGDRVLAVSALNFDLSVYDIFGLLAVGGSIVIPADKKAKDPAHWWELILSHQVTVWNTVPALMQMLVDYWSDHSDRETTLLKLVLLSGDWIPLSLPKQVKALGSDLQVISLGGATEASIWSIYYPIEKVEPTQKSIPYGKPLQNQRFYVLNESMEPCPLWVAGQLYIGGIGLAKGYWKNPEKTQSSFIINPLTKEPLYKTGDLGRYLPDGNIEFLGREDFQVKINGYRIELGEIEAALRQQTRVKESVVTTVGEQREKKRLVAYFVPNQNEITTKSLGQSEAYDPKQLEGVITDPLERIEFKLKQPGIRQLQPNEKTIELPRPEFDESLTQAYLARQSYRQFKQESIALEDFSQFLSCLLPMSLENYPLPKYRYPSAGSVYPVQTYLWLKPNAVKGLEAGIYYYYPSEHRLVLLSSVQEIDGSVYGGNRPIFEQSSFSLFLIGDLSAISPMYGDRGLNFCLLEAGHIGQLLMNDAPTYDLGLCPIGHLKFNQIEGLFKLESNKTLLYSFVGGKIEPNQTRNWYSSDSGQKPQSITEELRDHLRQKVPEYMVPKTFIELEALPLTPNGKINYKALPQPEQMLLESESTFVAPETSIEKQLAEMIASLLDLEKVGIYDNFFDIGGDSLVVTRLMSRVRETFEIDLPLRQFFEEPTITTIADYIETVAWVEQDFQLEDIEQEAEEI